MCLVDLNAATYQIGLSVIIPLPSFYGWVNETMLEVDEYRYEKKIHSMQLL